MDADRLKQIEDIYHAACDVAEDERDSFLDQRCGNDKDLRREVESLLTFDKTPSTFIDKPPDALAAEMYSRQETEPALTGRQIGHYKIEKLLGEGGMGAVYLAQDTKLDRKVAVKILNEKFAGNDSNLQRFVREAKATSGLNHPNILVIYEIGESDGMHYIVSEYVEGVTLREFIGKTAMSMGEVMEISIQIANALATAHTAHIVHRDIKPENIIVRPDGLVKILDFGLAKLIDLKPLGLENSTVKQNETAKGIILGTINYMSPEQLKGESVDERTDVWSFGVVLYEMLTGCLPFPGDSMSDVIASILKTDLIPPDQLNQNIPAELNKTIVKTLEKSRADRHETANNLLVDLRNTNRSLETPGGTGSLIVTRFADNKTGDDDKTKITEAAKVDKGTVFSSSYAGEGVSWRKFLVFGAIALAAITGISFGFGIFAPSLRSAGNQMPSAPRLNLTQLTTAGNVGETAISADGRYVAYSVTDRSKSSIRLRQTATTSDFEIVPPTDDFFGGMSFSPDGNYLYYQSVIYIYKIPSLGGPPQKISTDVSRGVTVSPDGNTIGFFRLDDRVWYLVLADVDGSNERMPFTPPNSSTIFATEGPAWSADGRKLICPLNVKDETGKTATRLFSVNIADGSSELIGDSEWLFINHIAWMPNGNVVVSGSIESSVKADTDNLLWLITANSPPQRLTNDLNMYGGIGATLNGEMLISSRVINKLNIVIAPNNDASRTVELSASADLNSLVWTFDEKLIYAELDKDIWMMNADGTNIKQLTSGQRAGYIAPMVADGRFIVFTSFLVDGVSQIWRMGLDGGNPTQLTSGDSHGHPEISLDGKWVVYGEYSEEKGKSIWKIPIGGGTPVRLTTFEGSNPAVNPVDGRIGFIFEDEMNGTNNIGFTSLAGTEAVTTRQLRPDVVEFEWTPDGRGIAYLDEDKDMTNVWSEPIEGKANPKMLTDFRIQKLNAFAWSPGGKKLAVIRRTTISDAVLLSESK